jgi:glutamate racemase
LPSIRKAVDVEVIGVIEPGARAAVAAAQGKPIGVIATEATVQSRAYARAINNIQAGTEVIERACPLFVSLAEEGWAETEVARSVADQYLSDFARRDIGALVLGCTHYPILRRVISETINAPIPLIDSGEATATEVKSLLASHALALTQDSQTTTTRKDDRQLCDDLDHFYVTDAAHRFARVAERFLGAAPSVLEAVEVWGQDELRTY